MLLNSRAVAILLAFSVSVVTTAFLSLVEGVSSVALIVTLILSFSSTYILVNIVLEFLIFREIDNLNRALDKLRKKDWTYFDSVKKESKNPIKRLNQEIYSYASIKQREIDELKKLEAFRREFLADVSHELKTPIFAAQGFVHTLLDGAIEDKSVRKKFLKKAAKSLDGLDMLVQDLLTLSHMETGDIKMHFETFDLESLTREVFEQFEGKAGKKGVVLEIEKDRKKPVIVQADYQRIYQVLLNLVSNAIKYTKDEGKVLVSFEESKNDIQVYVKDTGRGIPPEHLSRIFERFYRVEKSRSKEKGGTGLGLAIVKHILEAHNSKVIVTSAVGKGSTFSFKLKKGKAEHLVEKVLEDEE